MNEHRFLPEEATNYAIQNASDTTFSRQRAGLAGDVGRWMNLRKATSEGRAPTPFSRAYMFYLHLTGNQLAPAAAVLVPGAAEAGQAQEDAAPADAHQAAYQKAARQAFRGICATLALRQVLELSIKMKAIDPGTLKGNSVAEGIDDARQTAPAPVSFWSSIRYLVVEYKTEGQGVPEQVLAGLSPLTAFFPSASPLTQLDQLYWYDPAEGKWYDPVADFVKDPPAGESLRVAPSTLDTTKKYLLAWLESVLKLAEVDSRKAFDAFHIKQADEERILAELRLWQKELLEITSQKLLEEAKKIAVDQQATPPLIPGATLRLFEHAVKPEPDVRLETDLPVRNGRVLTSEKQEQNTNTRLYGRIMGGSKGVSRLRRATNLQLRCLDELFTPYLTCVTRLGVCEEWRLLELKEKGRPVEWYLLPFRKEVLDFLDWRTLLKSTEMTYKAGSSLWTVTLALPNLKIEKSYSDQPAQNASAGADGRVDRQILTDTLDLRVFPNFDLHTQYEAGGKKEYLVEREEDRAYYLRVRQSPFWDFGIDDFGIKPLVEDGQGKLADSGVEPVSLSAQPIPKDLRHCNATHCVRFFKVAPSHRPVGFEVAKRGLCFLSFKAPVIPGNGPESLRVGFDFGTSNSCISIKRQGADAEVLDLEVMTTTILKTCDYGCVFELPGQYVSVTEEGSAELDFFFRSDANTSRFTQLDYFPSVFVTLQSKARVRDGYDLRDGQPFFENISIADDVIINALKDYPEDPDPTREVRHTRRFMVRDEFKWPDSNDRQTKGPDSGDNQDWREPFLRSLRLMLILAVAKQKSARISQVVFSYPKAFPVTMVTSFAAACKKIWGTPGLISESEAICEWLIKRPEYQDQEHIVMDVGGGTTDLVAIHTKQPLCQASFRLAGGAINDYVVRSQRLQKQLLALTARHTTEKEQYTLERVTQIWGGFNDTFKRFAWFGLLQLLHDPKKPCLEEVLAGLRNQASDEPADCLAVRGYFLSLVLLFGGMAFHAGRLLRQVLENKLDGVTKLPFTCINMHLVGNGSAYYEMLESELAPFRLPFEGLFRAGLDFPKAIASVLVKFQNVPKDKSVKRPKALVSLGILHGEGGNIGDRLPVLAVPEDMDYYDKVAKAGHGHALDGTVPADLRAFFTALQQYLPNGSSHNDFEVVPFGGAQTNEGLDRELEQLYGSEVCRSFVRVHEIENAVNFREAQKKNREATLAVEPLFVTRLRGLIHAITQNYGRAS
jgi:hypothetical protein